MEFSIDINSKVLDEIGEIGRKAVALAIKYTAEEVWGNIKEEAPVDHGRLAGSFVLKNIDEFSWKITSNVSYALAVYTGTGIYGPERRPIEILPKNKKALYWPGAPHPVMRVLHPGQKPNDYPDRAINRARDRIDEFVRRAIRETIGGAA